MANGRIQFCVRTADLAKFPDRKKLEQIITEKIKAGFKPTSIAKPAMRTVAILNLSDLIIDKRNMLAYKTGVNRQTIMMQMIGLDY